MNGTIVNRVSDFFLANVAFVDSYFFYVKFSVREQSQVHSMDRMLCRHAPRAADLIMACGSHRVDGSLARLDLGRFRIHILGFDSV